MNVGSLLAVLVIFFAVPLNWYVAVRLIVLSHRNPEVRVVRERAVIAVALAVIATVFGLIFLNNELVPPILSGEVTKVITRGAVLIGSSIPSLYWLFLYRNWGPK